MSTLPENVIEQLRARTARAKKGFIITGAILAVPTFGLGLLLIAWAFVQEKRAEYLIEHGQLVNAELKADSPNAGDAWREQSYDAASFLPYKVSKFLREGMVYIGRVIPGVLVGFEFEGEDKWKYAAKYMFSNEVIERDEKGLARLLINPENPRTHSWLVAHIPADDASWFPTDELKNRGIHIDDYRNKKKVTSEDKRDAA